MMAASLNNRDIAILFWLFAFLAYALSKGAVRKSLLNVIKALFKKPLIISFSLMGIYIYLTTSLLSYLGLWNVSHLKATLFWSITTAAVMFFDIAQSEGDEHSFRKVVLDNFKVTIFIDFIVNLYVFSLIAELIFIPFSAILGGVLVIAESDEKYNSVRKLINGTLIILGVFLIGYAGYHIYDNFDNFARIKTITNFAVPPVLSLMFVPFIFLILVFMQYEILFARLRLLVKDDDLRRFIKRQLLRRYHFNIKKLSKWAKQLPFIDKNSEQDILESFKNV